MKMRFLAPLALVGGFVPVFGFVYTINGFTIIDDQVDSNFALVGFPGSDIGANTDGGFNFTRRWGNQGAATTATWTFGTGGAGDPLLATGDYEVLVSWIGAAQGNLNVAHYTGTDGFVAISVDQEPGSLSYAGTLGVETFYVPDPPVSAPGTATFVRLGTVSIGDGTFALTVVDDAVDTDFIFADAAALRLVPEPAFIGFWLALMAGGAVCRRRYR